MCKAIDVAEYIINYPDIYVDNLKLQKLVFYAQAISLVINDKPLFQDRIEAWAYGPVIPVLYRQYKNYEQQLPLDSEFKTSIRGDALKAVDLSIEHYGNMTGSQLITLTHSEKPWQDAYSAGRNSEITQESMREYYSTIYSYE